MHEYFGHERTAIVLFTDPVISRVDAPAQEVNTPTGNDEVNTRIEKMICRSMVYSTSDSHIGNQPVAGSYIEYRKTGSGSLESFEKIP